MRVLAVTLRDFRGYGDGRATFGPALSVITGPNGAGKTNLIEALYFGCTGRSCRTNNDREVVRFGAPAARVIVQIDADDGGHELAVGFQPGEPKRMRYDGAPVERLLDLAARPLVSVFLPDRLELVKGAPTLRRAHLDQFVSALWPSRAATRRGYSQTLAQRNALISRVRGGRGTRSALTSWDLQLARHGIALMQDRRQAIDTLSTTFPQVCAQLGLDGDPSVSYRPRSKATTVEQLAAELAERTDGDLERGFTGHGPHRDDLVLARAGHDLRTYGSQGQQRIGLLALLLAERAVLGELRAAPPVMLLDDVMSELDAERRRELVSLLRATPGQSVITTTDIEHVPGGTDDDVVHLSVTGGEIVQEARV